MGGRVMQQQRLIVLSRRRLFDGQMDTIANENRMKNVLSKGKGEFRGEYFEINGVKGKDTVIFYFLILFD